MCTGTGAVERLATVLHLARTNIALVPITINNQELIELLDPRCNVDVVSETMAGKQSACLFFDPVIPAPIRQWELEC